MKVIKQSIGIDISKKTFNVCMTFLLEDHSIKHITKNNFSNSLSGFKNLIKWVQKKRDKDTPVHYSMEATGYYYESLAFYLEKEGYVVHILLPNNVKKFAQILNIKSKTDDIDAKIIAQIGSERELRQWKLSSPIFRELRNYTREREALVD